MKGSGKLFFVVLVLALFMVPVLAQDTGPDANKALVLAWFEAEAARQYDRMGEFFAEDVIRHSVATTAVMPEVRVTNREEYALFLQDTAAMFPDYQVTPQMLIAEGDYVAWFGLWSGTYVENGNPVEVPLVGFFRFEAGKIAEIMVEWDNVSWGAQMNEGALPLPVAAYEPPASGTFDPEASRALFLSFAEAELSRDYDRFDELLVEDFARHSTATPEVQVNSRDGFKEFLQVTAGLFPDYVNTAQMIVAENDLVAVYAEMSGTFAETEREVNFPFVAFFRVEDNKIAELWVEWDNLTVMTQMGVIPVPVAAQLPMGVYTTTITLDDIEGEVFLGAEDLVGTWEVEITEAGEVNWQYFADDGDREFAITTEYSLTGNTLMLGEERGEYSCNQMYDMTSATYNWMWDGAHLNFNDLDDACIQRKIVLTSHPLVILPEAGLP